MAVETVHGVGSAPGEFRSSASRAELACEEMVCSIDSVSSRERRSRV